MTSPSRGPVALLLTCALTATAVSGQTCPPAPLPLTHAPIAGLDGHTLALGQFEGGSAVQTPGGPGELKVSHLLAPGQGLFGSDALRLVNHGAAIYPLQGFDPFWGTLELWIKPDADVTSRQVLLSIQGRHSLDGDRWSDLFVGETGTSPVPVTSKLYFGSATGLRTDVPALVTTVATRGLQATDINRDGHLDLIVANNAADTVAAPLTPLGGEVHVFEGPFAAGQVLGTPDTTIEVDQAQGLLVEDFNQDGFPDIAAASFNEIASPIWGFSNDGNGVFTTAFGTLNPDFWTAAEGLAAGDVDKDGVLDILYGSFAVGSSYVMKGVLNGSQYSVPASQAMERSNQTLGVSMADVNGDGWLDCLLAQPLFDHGVGQVPGRVAIHLNDGMGGFRITADAVYQTPRPFTINAEHDVNNDGWLDLAVANWRNGQGSTPESTVILGPLDGGDHGTLRFLVDDAVSLALGDLDDDGLDDIVFHSATDTQSAVFLLDADGQGRNGVDGQGRFLPSQLLDTLPTVGNVAGEGAGMLIAQVGGTTTYGTRVDRTNSLELFVENGQLHFLVHDDDGIPHQVSAPLPGPGDVDAVDGYHHVQAGWWGAAGLLELHVGDPSDPANLFQLIEPQAWTLGDVATVFRLGGDPENQQAPGGWLVDDLRLSDVRRVTLDADLDGIPDDWDNCPGSFNPDQADGGDDGLGDACETCQPDLGFGGPGSVSISLCGQPLCTGEAPLFRLNGAAPFTPGLLVASLAINPTPLKGGTLVPLPIALQLPIQTDGAGRILIPVPGGAFGAGTLDLFLQTALFDGAQPQGVAFSNALRAHFID